MNELSLAPYAAQVTWQSATALDEHAHRELLAVMLQAIAGRSEAAGARLIGHIKALASFPNAGYLRGSVTNFDQVTDVVGAAPGRHRQFDVTLNVLVYGLTIEDVDRTVQDALHTLARRQRATCVVEHPLHHPERPDS